MARPLRGQKAPLQGIEKTRRKYLKVSPNFTLKLVLHVCETCKGECQVGSWINRHGDL